MNSILKKIIIVIWTFALIIPSVPVTAAETAEEPGKTDTLYIDVFIPDIIIGDSIGVRS